MTTIADRLKRAREARKLGSNALDRLAGLSQGTTSRYETGARGGAPPASTVAKLADALRIRQRWLADGEGPMEMGTPETLKTLRDHPRWATLCAEARRIRPALGDADFERVADSPFLFGPLDSVDATLLADLASNVADWAARTATAGGRRP